MSLEICRYFSYNEKILDLRWSQISACSILISFNIGQLDTRLSGTDKAKFDCSKWNNMKVFYSTGYSIEMLKPVLYEVAVFMSQFLKPNKLRDFELESILE